MTTMAADEMLLLMQGMMKAIATLQEEAAATRSGSAGSGDRDNAAMPNRPERFLLDTRGWKVGVFEGKQAEWTEW